MRNLTKIMVMFTFAFISSVSLFAQNWNYTETFENHNATIGGYTNNSFLGDNGVTWTYVRGRADNGYQVNPENKSFMLGGGAPQSTIKSSVISGGINDLKISMKKAFTGAGNRQIALYINGNFIANSIAWDNTNVQVFEVNDLEIVGDVVIEFRNLGSQVSIDDLKWTTFGAGHGGIPYKVRISSVKPAVPMKNIPFRTLIELVDNIGYTQSIPHPTKIVFTILDATANLLHQQTFNIPANSAVYFVENLNLNYSGKITIIAEAPDNKNLAGYYLDDASESFNVSKKPNLSLDIFNKGHVGSTHPVITVKALDDNGNVNPNYHLLTGNLNISNGSFTGTITAIFEKGIATFKDIVFTSPNTEYSVFTSAQYLDNSIAKTVSVLPAPTMTEIIIPRYLKGEGTFIDQNGNGRLPSFALVQFNNLHPNTEYRFLTGASLTLPNTASTTAGNMIVYDYMTNNYEMTAAKNLKVENSYSSFKTGNSESSKTIWINMIPTNNAIFAVNNENYWTIDLANSNGDVITRLNSIKTSRNLRLSSAANNFTTGLVSYASGIFDPQSPSSPKNYIVLYDQDNNPVSTAIVQANGSTLATPGFAHQAPAFYADYESVNGAWSTYIPNNLPGGIRKIAEFSPKGELVKEWTDDDGVWASYNTITSNYGLYPPSENSSETQFAVPQFDLLSPNTNSEVCNTLEGITLLWNSRGIDLINIYVNSDDEGWEPIALNYNSRENSYIWTAIRNKYSNSNIKIKIQSVEFSYISYVTGNFKIFDTPIITGYSESNVWCPEENIILTVEAEGSNLTYQWYKDGRMLTNNADYSGVNTPVLTIDKLLHRLAGSYTVTVSGHPSCESVKSGPIIVYVARPISIFKPTYDVNIGVKLGEKATLEFTVHGNGGNGLQDDLEKYNVKVQWYKYDPNLPVDVPLDDNMPRFAGSKTNYLTINKFRKQDEGKYYAVVKGLCGTAVKTPYFDVKEVDFSITEEPRDSKICLDNTVEFSFDYISNSNENPIITWYKDGVLLTNNDHISGADTKSLTIKNIKESDAGIYHAEVTLKESGQKIRTKDVSLFVFKTVVISSHTESPATFELGKSILLEVVADANEGEELEYQWYKNNVLIEGANEATYTKEESTPEDEGVYTCKVKGICNEITSEPIEVVIATGTTSVREVARFGFSLSEVSPNPTVNNFRINVTSPENTNAEIIITDMTGRSITTIFSGLLSEGTHNLNVNLDKFNLVTGTYFITLRTPRVALTQNFTIIK